MSDRPDWCCGACPAIEPNPEHPDCEACRTGFDCTCRDNPRCPNYQEPTMTDITDQDCRHARQWADGISSSRILNENAKAAVRYILATTEPPEPTPADELRDVADNYGMSSRAADRLRNIADRVEHDLAEARAEANRLTTERDEKPLQKAAETNAETTTPADVQPGEAWLVEVGREKRTAVKDSDAAIPWNTVNTSGVFHAEYNEDVTLLTRLVPAHRTITDPDDLDRLRARTIILDGTGHACTKNSPGFFSRSDFTLTMITTEQCLANGPVTVLWEPGA